MPRITGPERTFTFTESFVTCPDCGHRLELASDGRVQGGQDDTYYYYCDGCGTDWTLDGKKIKRFDCGEIIP